MREYKMRRGEHLEERVEDMEAFVEEYFGPVASTTEYNGSDLLVVEEPENPAFERVTAGTVEYGGKKNKLALDIEECPAKELVEKGLLEAAEDAVDIKNDFLKAGTGRDAKSRRESMKRDVEDDETPDSVA